MPIRSYHIHSGHRSSALWLYGAPPETTLLSALRSAPPPALLCLATPVVAWGVGGVCPPSNADQVVSYSFRPSVFGLRSLGARQSTAHSRPCLLSAPPPLPATHGIDCTLRSSNGSLHLHLYDVFIRISTHSSTNPSASLRIHLHLYRVHLHLYRVHLFASGIYVSILSTTRPLRSALSLP
jgi:hypothetical protein